MKVNVKRFYDVLPKRLNKYELNIDEAKSQMIKSGRDNAANLAKQSKKIASYNFLGFTCYCSKSKILKFQDKIKSAKPIDESVFVHSIP
ncbi:putative reverse transcriptase [Orientia tsutsugamushi str. TA716]|uniref:Putative reverse transcriptase n=2 Tax=Orientia tsutsugamushi TaxID=784 RepID=A0A0F3P8K1_ORITS|nr:putative reverse transcriptase [Orientia tsutsugamushi str. TA716]